MAKAEFAPGLPDPARFGRVTTLPIGRPLPYVIQRHLAERAGPHYDIRFGPNGGTRPTLFSWAGRKLPEEPGQKTLAFRQPLHTGQYAGFEGEITSGYGKGVVKTHDKGAVLVTKVTPDKINFVVIHKKHPETFTMIRRTGPPVGDVTARTKKTQGGTWLLINTTPTDVIEHKKIHYTKVPAEQIHKLFDPEYLHMEKIDGAAALYKLLSDRIEVLSYRPTTTGRPIVHTYRVGGTTGVNIPKHLVGSVLRGEIFGVRTPTGEAIPAQELGGILNSSTLKALQKKQEQKVKLKNAIFNVMRYGKAPVSIDEPLAQRMTKLKEIMQHLPQDTFQIPRSAATVEEQKKLWGEIRSGEYPLTHEGIVAWPRKGGKPTKVKLYSEHDVHVKEIFPGKDRLAGVGAGGFKYALKPTGPVVGKVGTGFTEETRRLMHERPEEFIGRIARIRAQEQFPSGAYRAPGFLALHEDYPGAQKAAQDFGRIGEVMGGQDVPHLQVGPEAVAAGYPPVYAGFAPPLFAGFDPYLKRVMARMPELARAIKRRGAILASPNLPPAVLAHEMGHATGFGASKPYSGFIGLSRLLGGTSPAEVLGVGEGTGFDLPLGTTTLGALAGRAAKSPKVAGLAALLLSAPGLLDEFRASWRARRALKQLGGWDPASKKTLTKGFTSYLPGVAASTGLAMIVAKLLMKKASKQPMKKEAITPEEATAAQQQAGAMLAPTTAKELAKTLATSAASVPILSTGFGGLRVLGRGLRHPLTPLAIGGAGGITGALGRRLTLKNMLSGPKFLYSPAAAGLSSALEGFTTLTGALKDPEYMARQIGLASAAAKQLRHMGRGASLRAQEAYTGRFGALKGVAMTPIHALMNPLSTIAAFSQALKRVLSREKSAAVLGPMIEKLTDGKGDTLADLVKTAAMFAPATPPELSPALATEIGIKPKLPLADRLRALIFGIKPSELKSLQLGAGGMARVIEKIRSFLPAAA